MTPIKITKETAEKVMMLNGQIDNSKPVEGYELNAAALLFAESVDATVSHMKRLDRNEALVFSAIYPKGIPVDELIHLAEMKLAGC